MHSFSLDDLRHDVAASVEEAITTNRIVNIPVLAEKLRSKHEHLNIALEDVEALVLQSAQRHVFPIEFDGRSNGGI